MTGPSRPTTEAGRELLNDWQIDEFDLRPFQPFYVHLVNLVTQMRDRVLAIEAEARADSQREAARLREALVFAASVIKSGEGWTATCEQIIRGALAVPAEDGHQ